MAQVAEDKRAGPDIDYHLDYQFNAWRSVAEYAEWWPALDAVDKEVVQLEWEGITESRLRLVEQWAADDRLTPTQRSRYDHLRRLIEEHRPILARLWGA